MLNNTIIDVLVSEPLKFMIIARLFYSLPDLKVTDHVVYQLIYCATIQGEIQRIYSESPLWKAFNDFENYRNT